MTTRKGTTKKLAARRRPRKLQPRLKFMITKHELMRSFDPRNNDAKSDDLQKNTEEGAGEFLTTNHGVRINDNQNSLKAGERGPSLLEDFILREKITTSITNGSRNAWSMRAAPRHTGIFKSTNR